MAEHQNAHLFGKYVPNATSRLPRLMRENDKSRNLPVQFVRNGTSLSSSRRSRDDEAMKVEDNGFKFKLIKRHCISSEDDRDGGGGLHGC